MSKILSLEVPDEQAQPMVEAAQRSGQTLEEWALHQLRRIAPTSQEREAALADLAKHIVTAPHAVGADNESIDRDLALEYGSTHEDG